jgi:hypothetical protein
MYKGAMLPQCVRVQQCDQTLCERKSPKIWPAFYQNEFLK